MKPPVFKYVAARSVDEAVSHLAQHAGDAKVLAGGQSLTPMLNFRLARPKVLVDINRIGGLDGIKSDKGALTIGTLVRHRTVETSPVIAERFPILAAAAKQVGHLAIRNRGTFGGSLAHNDPAAEFPMIALLLDAEIKTKSSGGGRTIKAKDFFVTYLTSAVQDGEMVTEVRIPELPAKTGWGFEELSRRPGDFALAAVAATVTMNGGKCAEARISMAGVGPNPLRASEAEGLLKGQQLDEGLLKKAAAAAAKSADPSNDVHASADFRRHLVDVLTQRALKAAVERAGKA
ncbi:MAG: xanthine dehydrogenase family protein subunit M [Candidatus Binatia bacterium]